MLLSAAYAVWGLLRHWQFESNYDLGIFNQAVWHLSRFEAPASTVSGFTNVLGDHFSPIIAALAPLYWIHPGAETLIVAQAALFGLSVIPVHAYLRARLPARAALLLAGAYGLFWGLQQAVTFDVHEMAFAPLFIAVMLLASDRRAWGWMWTAAILLALVKEDLIPLPACLGLGLWFRGDRRQGALMCVTFGLVFLVVVRVVIPFFSDTGAYAVGSAYGDVLRQPWTIPATLVTPPVKLRTAFFWLASFALLPLRSPLVLMLVPLALERFLSASALHWGTSFHYSVPVAPIVAMAAGDGLAKLSASFDATVRNRFVDRLAITTLLLSSLLPGHQPLWRLWSPSSYEMGAAEGYRAMALIPESASVVAQTAILPHISQRREVFRLMPGAPDAEFVIAGYGLSPWPNPDPAALGALLDERRQRGYTVVFDEGGWTVLRAP